jgi:hypothetical protein
MRVASTSKCSASVVHVALLAALFTLPLSGQQDDTSYLAAKRDQKLAAPFLRCSAWTTDFEQAKEAAKASGRIVLGYFTRSYAPCGPCTQLEQTIFAKPDFVEFARGVVLFCHVSTRLPSDPSAFLFTELGGTAFPTVMALDAEGHVLARRTGVRCLRDLRDLVADGTAFARAIAQSAQASPEVRAEVLAQRIAFGHLTSEEARVAVAALGALSAERASDFETAIVARECAVVLLEIRKASDESSRLRAARRFVEMKNAGRVPADANAPAFWDWVTAYAAHVRDVALFEEGVVALRPLFAGDPASIERLREKEASLEGLKRGVVAGVVQAAGKN